MADPCAQDYPLTASWQRPESPYISLHFSSNYLLEVQLDVILTHPPQRNPLAGHRLAQANERWDLDQSDGTKQTADVNAGRGKRRPAPAMATVTAAETQHFLHTAADLAANRVRNAAAPWDEAHLAAFLQLYKGWIMQALGMANAPEVWAERNAILLHLMTGGATIGEAIGMLVRFAQTVWGSHMRLEYVDEGEAAGLVFHESTRPDEEGLICALWSLRANLSQIEFLAGGELDGVSGRVRYDQCLPGTVTNLLFGQPLVFGAADTALVIPKSELGRAVAVRTSDIPRFLAHFMRTMVGAYRSSNTLRSLISTLICDDRLRGAVEPADMPTVARRLGLSTATARRRLHEEGVTFRGVKAEALDQLAKLWLREKWRTIDHISERLGYSDAHAFRRAFHRSNGMSPRTYRSLGSATATGHQ